MKKSVLILSMLVVTILVATIVYFYVPQRMENNIKNNLSHSYNQTKKTSPLSKEVIVNQTSNIVDNADIQVKSKDTIGEDFISKIQNIIMGSGSRLVKLETFKSMFNNSKSEDEKIAALQSMAFLKPIEHTDFLIGIANNTQESDIVRGEALRALNNAYLLDENLVQEIGGSNVYIGTKKISQYMDNIVNDPRTSPQLYEIALSSYSYTNHEKAVPLAKSFLNEGKKLNDAKSGFVTNVAFSDKDNMKDFILFYILYSKCRFFIIFLVK